MKAVKNYGHAVLIAASVFVFSADLAAQTENPPVKMQKIQTVEDKSAAPAQPIVATTPEKSAAEIASTAVIKTDDKSVARSAEESEILPFYNNYLKEYRLGPNDVITVEVFGQCPDYCKPSISIPPTARISYPLIREGVMVGGKTVEEVAAEITKKLDEYIIQPNVTVTLDKAMSARYSVLGKVAAPGVRVLDRKVSVYEAIVESGGVTKEGDKKRVVVYRYDGQGRISPQIVDLSAMEKGKGEMIFLNPGDQVFVPDKGFRLNVNTVFDILSKASIVRLLFGSPF